MEAHGVLSELITLYEASTPGSSSLFEEAVADFIEGVVAEELAIPSEERMLSKCCLEYVGTRKAADDARVSPEEEKDLEDLIAKAATSNAEQTKKMEDRFATRNLANLKETKSKSKLLLLIHTLEVGKSKKKAIPLPEAEPAKQESKDAGANSSPHRPVKQRRIQMASPTSLKSGLESSLTGERISDVKSDGTSSRADSVQLHLAQLRASHRTFWTFPLRVWHKSVGGTDKQNRPQRFLEVSEDGQTSTKVFFMGTVQIKKVDHVGVGDVIEISNGAVWFADGQANLSFYHTSTGSVRILTETEGGGVADAPEVHIRSLEQAKQENPGALVSIAVYVSEVHTAIEITMADKQVMKREVSCVDSDGNELVVALLDAAARCQIVKQGAFLLICRAKVSKYGVDIWPDASIEVLPDDHVFEVHAPTDRNVL